MEFTHNETRACLDLFKVVPFSKVKELCDTTMVPIDRQLEQGLIFVNKNMQPVETPKGIFAEAAMLYGISAEDMNTTFYKSFNTVLEKTRFEIFVDQVIHYFGTYGMEMLGEKPVTILPLQRLEVPDVDLSKIHVTIIREAEDGQIVNLLNNLAATVAQPSTRIRENFSWLIDKLDMPLDDIKSFELAVIAYDWFNQPPRSGKTFLRYLVYKATGAPLVINNDRTIQTIRSQPSWNTEFVNLFAKADLVSLARVFLRNKDLFLAFKHFDGCAPYINKIRRLAKSHHQPLSPVTPQNFIQLVLTDRKSEVDQLVERMSVTDCIKIINAILVRVNTQSTRPGVYNVRNGRTYIKEAGLEPVLKHERTDLLHYAAVLLCRVANHIRKNVEGKTFYIPGYINYAVPQSSKQYVGNFPWGTCVKNVNKDGDQVFDQPITIGVHWLNQGKNGEHRVDLDLHAMSPTTHYGWNAAYSEKGGRVIYTGDMTNAPLPHGAAEAFWLENVDEPIFFTLNKFCGIERVPYQLYFSAVQPHGAPEMFYARRDTPYTMDPNELMFAPIPLEITPESRNNAIGFYHNGDFVFYSGNMDEGRVPQDCYKMYLEGLVATQTYHISMDCLLREAGAMVINTETGYNECEKAGIEVIDLSPDKLTATTFEDIMNA